MAERGPDESREEILQPHTLTPIVGIGASAGGLKALTEFLDAMPPDAGAAFVVIVHLDPNARSDLPNILASKSKMPVRQVTESAELNANCIYVIPPDRQLHVADGEVSALPFKEPRGQRAPIDLFFRSLAEQHGDGFAVVLSGAGSDGAAGVTAIKEHGGIVLVQSPDEAEYASMPRSAIATKAVDFILPARQLAERIVELLRVKRQTAIAPAHAAEDEIQRILTHLRTRTGHDFTFYKRSTVLRRIVRRMQVARKESLEEYFRYLRETPEEPQALLSDLLISVTTFFRDPKAFESLARHAIPNLFRNDQRDGSLRVWIAGCATGEEAYSIAMLLLEEASKHDVHPEIQVFGSDMDSHALAIAREGRYSVAIEADLSEERLRHFFTLDGEYYRVKRELRDIVLFANHSLLKDPPFSRINLISCRNLLIYLNRELQQELLATLHYALNPNGYLFLGSSENADHPSGLFRLVDRETRIYQSAGGMPDHLQVVPRLGGVSAKASTYQPGPPPATLGARAAQVAHLETLERLAPPSILVDEFFRVVHLSETAGRYLMPSGGPLTTDIADLVRPELRFELRAALHRAFERDESTLTGAISVRFNGKPIRVYMQVRPFATGDSGLRRALVVFVEGEEFDALADPTAEQRANGDAATRLKHELELAQTRLRTMREESEAANEELRAANEELQSINEEYRSTAEELETSKEELQSINEELQTVNSELKLKLDSVSRANSDLQNLMASTDYATLFLDPSLKIKRFTPKVAELFNVTRGDVGRPITDFTHQLEYDGISRDSALALQDRSPLEREIRSRNGNWYLVRYRPYRIADDKIDGIVITFVDVTRRRRSEDALRASEQKLREQMRLVDLSRWPIFIWDFDTGAITQWNRGCEILYGFSKEEAIGQSAETLVKTTSSRGPLATLKEVLLKDGVWKGEVRQTAKEKKRPIRVESALELIPAEGRRYVFESGREIKS
jgi:two-component system CheB/CheR fusion protein